MRRSGRELILGGVLAASLGLAAPFWIGAIAAAALIPFVWSSYSEDAVNVARRLVDAEAGAPERGQ